MSESEGDYMATLDERYKKLYKEMNKPSEREINDHNNDIDIIYSVIDKILTTAEADIPLGGFELVDVTSSGKTDEFICWSFFSKSDLKPVYKDFVRTSDGYAVLSNGRIICRYFNIRNYYIEFIRADNNTESINDCLYWRFVDPEAETYQICVKDKASDIRKQIVKLAVEKLGLTPMDEWLYEATEIVR